MNFEIDDNLNFNLNLKTACVHTDRIQKGLEVGCDTSGIKLLDNSLHNLNSDVCCVFKIPRFVFKSLVNIQSKLTFLATNHVDIA